MMGIYRYSALLSLLRLRLEKDRGEDWQELQSRDRSWFLAQGETSRWELVDGWLREFERPLPGGLALLVFTLGLLAFIAGFALIGGLLEFTRLERINLLWFLALGLAGPFVLWLLGLFAAVGRGSFPLFALLEHRAPSWMQNHTLSPLLRRTAVVLSQQISLLFAAGMLAAFGLYLLVTDLAFGWSSTLDISATSLHRLTAVLAWPWQWLWPDAVPSLTLVEQSRFYRAAPPAEVNPELLGQWWRFLLMCLLVYVCLPRLLSFAWHCWRLRKMQLNSFASDALIAGWWQRLQSSALSQQAEAVQQLGESREVAGGVKRLPLCPHVVLWGIWSDAQWGPVKEILNSKIPQFQLYKVPDKQWLARTAESILRNPDDKAMIVCKGWEPPTGELADFCRSIESDATPRFLWPVALTGMPPERVSALNRSWRAFIPSLPDSYRLYLGSPDE